MLTLAKTPRLSLKKASHNTQHVTLAQVYSALRKQTIKARPTTCASLGRYSFWNDTKVSGSAATVRKVFLSGFGV